MIRPFRGVSPQIHPTAFIEESAQVVGDVHIGAHSSVWFGAVVRGDVFHIRIGDRTNVQDGTVIHVSNGTHATILEDEVTAASASARWSRRARSSRPAPSSRRARS
jgi:carbonic anhydrase/acetyltransferase-like protein (isoleucine patch superfamily)